MAIIRKDSGSVTLVESTSPVEISDSYAKLGNRIDARTSDSIGLWLELDIGDSTGVRVKAFAFTSDDSTKAYELPIRDVSATQISIQDEELVFGVDADQNMVLELETNGIVPFVEFYIKDSADGSGQVDSAYLTFNNARK